MNADAWLGVIALVAVFVLGVLTGRWDRMSFDFFRATNVSWPHGLHLTRSTWHSCMQWGWPSIRRGEHSERWAEYFTLSIRIGDRGWSVQWWPHKRWMRSC